MPDVADVADGRKGKKRRLTVSVRLALKIYTIESIDQIKTKTI